MGTTTYTMYIWILRNVKVISSVQRLEIVSDHAEKA